MKQQQVYNLKEFAAKYQLKDIFGAYVAHIHTDVLNGSVLRDVASERTLFYKILLVKSGSVKLSWELKVLRMRNISLRQVICLSHRLSMFISLPKYRKILRPNVFLLMKRFLMIWFIIFLTINSRRLLISFI